MRIALRSAAFAAAVLMLTGCQVLASLFEDRLLRGLSLFIVAAAILGFLVSRMRR